MSMIWRDCLGRRLIVSAALMVVAVIGIEWAAHEFGWDISIITIGGPR